jgi:8-oxo-dGTP pyrophosphatase MutT (NUDIX family)
MVDNPWKKVSSRVVYQNPWITVREDQVITPRGEPGIYGVVEPRLATGVVALTQDNQIYLVGQYRYPLDIYSWEIPEGGAEHGEDPLEAIKRELLEEAGVTAKSWKQIGHEIHLSNCFTNERAYLYLATDLEVGPSAPDATEVLQVRTVPLEEAFAMIQRGEITDAMTIMGVTMVVSSLGKTGSFF